jgi:hypothetical protein
MWDGWVLSLQATEMVLNGAVEVGAVELDGDAPGLAGLDAAAPLAERLCAAARRLNVVISRTWSRYW